MQDKRSSVLSKHGLAPRIGAFLLLSVLSLALLLLPQQLAATLVDEDGPIESLTAALWFFGAAAALVTAFRSRPPTWEWLFGGFGMLLFAARELSWHTHFTGWSVTRVESYLDASIPLWGRLLGLLLVVVPAAVSLIGLIVRLGPRFRRAWWQGAAWARDIPLWLLLLVISQVLDKGHKVFPPLGFDIPVHYTRLFEETIELALPVYVLFAIWPLCFARNALSADQVTTSFVGPVSD